MIPKEILKHVKNSILSEPEVILNTDFQDLDYILRGIEKGSIITIGARPSMGKTAFAINILINFLKQNKNCLFCSLELSAERIIKRILAIISEINIQKLYLNNNNCLTEKQIKKINEAISKIENYDLSIADNISTLKEIKENIIKTQPEFVFIDYIQLINSSSKKCRAEALNEILRELKKIAKENSCIIFLISQLSRKVEERCDKHPMLSDLRESGGIENISDVVLFVYRPEYYVFNNPALKNKAEIIVAKNSFGAVGAIDLLFRGEIQKFSERIKIEQL